MSTYLQRLEIAVAAVDDLVAARQVQAIRQTIQDLRRQDLPSQQLPSLGLLPDHKADLMAQFSPQTVQQLDNLLNNFRSYLSRAFGIWSLPNLHTASLLKEKFGLQTVLEIMAGNGYWSKALQLAGCRLITTDSLEWAITSNTGAEPAVPVHNCDAVKALTKWGRQVDAIICAWAPNFNQTDWQLLQTYRELRLTSPLFFIGERDGATNSPRFWSEASFSAGPALAAINRSFRSFDFLDEKFFLVK
ncbi:MAG: class I SAM-dependent methyltransferase [Lactobacillus sp.]|nr:class I SAM-dependent methyltransferase [Lactobacillus sp.]